MRISDWSSDVCSSDLVLTARGAGDRLVHQRAAQIVDAGAQGCDGAVAAQLHPAGLNVRDQRMEHKAGDGVHQQIGRASCREGVWPYGEISGDAVSFKKNTETIKTIKRQHTIIK